MPNADNIACPITLIANGRSGTSLVMHILGDHPDVDACGETQQVLTGVWHAAERMKGIIRPDQTLDQDAPHDVRCGKAVRAAFLATFPDTGAAEWFHKPIGVPADPPAAFAKEDRLVLECTSPQLSGQPQSHGVASSL